MAAQRGRGLSEKVSRLLENNTKTVNTKHGLKPNRPLILRDHVADRRPGRGEASCTTEMSVLMACWKQNNFLDSHCSDQISSFYTCVQRAQAVLKEGSGGVQAGRLTPRQANTLLSRFPNQRSEI